MKLNGNSKKNANKNTINYCKVIFIVIHRMIAISSLKINIFVLSMIKTICTRVSYN